MKIDDLDVINDFGNEWNYYDQLNLNDKEGEKIFLNYFGIFPWKLIGKESVGFDMGSGSGRWAKFVAPKVKHLHCIEPSEAIKISMQNLSNNENCSFHPASPYAISKTGTDLIARFYAEAYKMKIKSVPVFEIA